jgi:hypothetical protein
MVNTVGGRFRESRMESVNCACGSLKCAGAVMTGKFMTLVLQSPAAAVTVVPQPVPPRSARSPNCNGAGLLVTDTLADFGVSQPLTA